MRMTIRDVKSTVNSAMIEGAVRYETSIKPAVQAELAGTSPHSKKTRTLAMVMLVALLVPMFAMTALGTTALEGSVNQAAKDVYNFIKNIVVTIGVAALGACGIVLLLGIGGQRASENAKAWMIRIAIGLAIIFLADPLVNWVKGIAEGASGAGGSGGGGGGSTGG